MAPVGLMWRHLASGLLITCCAIKLGASGQPLGATHPQPNIIMVVADDLGYGDLASYGHPTQEWNALDRMAMEGVRFTQFYSPASFCTPSRAALLTGRLPVRTGMIGDYPVLLPGHSTGLPRSEVTIAELLKQAGYRTGIVGKWHLGINEFNSSDGAHLPDKHGFDYVGTLLPFSLDSVCDNTGRHRAHPRTARCFLYRGGDIVQQPPTLSSLTRTLVADARAFIHAHDTKREKREPFFLLLSLPQVHTPMFNDALLKNTSARGEYGDQVAEMAWAVEQTLEAVRHLAAKNDTMVVFVSDHGPHIEMCDEGGSVGPLRGGKGNLYEGGVRVPAFFWWPGHIKPQPSNAAIAAHMDLLPTLADFAGIPLPSSTHTDGISLLPLLQPEVHMRALDPTSGLFAERALFFHCSHWLVAVRHGRYKVYFREQHIAVEVDRKFSHCTSGVSRMNFYTDIDCASHRKLEEPAVYDVVTDPGEHRHVTGAVRDAVLLAVDPLVEEHLQGLDIPREHLLDSKYVSNALTPCCNPPYCLCNRG